MDLFLLHFLILIWASIGAGRRLAARLADQLLVAALLAWGNIVATSLALSMFHRLGEPEWFLGTSLFLVLATSLWLRLIPTATPREDVSREGTETRPNQWLLTGFILTIAPLALANLAVACNYVPNSYDAQTGQLPRVLFYLGQGNLGHFDASDSRQILLPFNYSLLQAFGLIYGSTLEVLNIFNLTAWAVSGIALYRLCRSCAIGANAALVACWLGLTATPVLAQATATTNELPASAAFLCALLFARNWASTRLMRDALLAGLATGLAAGSSLAILYFGPVLLLLAVACGRQSWRRGDFSARPDPIRAWIVPTLVALLAGAPFALINLTGKGNWAAGLVLPRPLLETTGQVWAGFLPLPGKPSLLQPLDESTVGFGFAGSLVLLGAVLCFITYRTKANPAHWFAWLGLGWVLARLCLAQAIPFRLQEFVPAFLVSCPCMAAALETARTGRSGPKYASYLLTLLVVMVTGWSAGIYSLRNTSRPMLPLLNPAFTRPALPGIPLAMEISLADQPRINLDTDGIEERTFAFLRQGHDQRFTSHRHIDPDAYNLISRSSLSRDAAYENRAQLPSYTLIPIPKKRTAGVELLASIGSGDGARDYFKIPPHVERVVPTKENWNVLVTVYHVAPQAGSEASVLVTVAGLTVGDRAQLVVNVEHDDHRVDRLATFNADGEILAPLQARFRQLAFRIFDADSGAEIGATAIQRRIQDGETIPAFAPRSAPNDRLIFVTELVSAKATPEITVNGLLPVDGPFPQWDLPLLRWARQPLTRITLSPTDGFSRLQLSFSVRLHTRSRGALDVLLNGQFVQRYRIEGQSTWLDQTLELTPQPGENVLEFRDAPLNRQPAWEDYLDRYPDVKAHLVENHMPLEAGAWEHYEKFGKAERRTMQTDEVPTAPPDSYYFMYRHIRLEGFRSP